MQKKTVNFKEVKLGKTEAFDSAFIELGFYLLDYEGGSLDLVFVYQEQGVKINTVNLITVVSRGNRIELHALLGHVQESKPIEESIYNSSRTMEVEKIEYAKKGMVSESFALELVRTLTNKKTWR